MATTMNLTGRLVAVGSVCGRRRVLMTFADRQRSLGSTMTCGCDSPGCLAIVCVGSVAQEDFDALPVEELAAIALNILAADHVLGWLPMEVDDVLWTDIAGVVEPPEREVTRAAVGALSAFEFDSAVDMTDVYAAAEAALRNGEVR